LLEVARKFSRAAGQTSSFAGPRWFRRTFGSL